MDALRGDLRSGDAVSDFDRAIARVLAHEGGYVHDPADPGGETRFGISRRWANSVGKIGLDIRALTQAQAVTFYREYWWDEYRYAEIRTSAWPRSSWTWPWWPAPRHRTSACSGRCSPSPSSPRTHPCESTRTACSGRRPARRPTARRAHCLLAALKSEQAGYFRDLDKPRFEKGWEARAYA